MPSKYQQQNLEAMLGLFLQAQGYPLPEHSKSKSASALSRFLNIYHWSTRSVIRTARSRIIQEILSHCPKGRKPCLQSLKFPVYVSWYYFKRDDGKYEKRFVEFLRGGKDY
jgi:hypothetical protein